MIFNDWYVKEYKSDGDNFLSHRNNDLLLKFEDINKNDICPKPQYKNTITLIFSHRAGPSGNWSKTFGVNLNCNEIEELIKQLENVSKQLKLNSFKTTDE